MLQLLIFSVRDVPFYKIYTILFACVRIWREDRAMSNGNVWRGKSHDGVTFAILYRLVFGGWSSLRFLQHARPSTYHRSRSSCYFVRWHASFSCLYFSCVTVLWTLFRCWTASKGKIVFPQPLTRNRTNVKRKFFTDDIQSCWNSKCK